MTLVELVSSDDVKPKTPKQKASKPAVSQPAATEAKPAVTETQPEVPEEATDAQAEGTAETDASSAADPMEAVEGETAEASETPVDEGDAKADSGPAVKTD
jgi:hypothetical protein